MNAMSPAMADLFAEARQVSIRDVAERLGATLKRNGTDWAGPCPAGCCKSDGFVITPKAGVFICRKSDVGGDAIDLCVHCLDMTRSEAAAFVAGRELPDKHEETPDEAAARRQRQAAREKAIAKRKADDEREDLARRQRDIEACASILSRATPIAGTHAEAYLHEGRGLNPPRWMTKDILFVRSLDYWADVKGSKRKQILATLPAMVSIFRDVSGNKTGLHITYLDPQIPAKWVDPAERHLNPKHRKHLAKKWRKIAPDLSGGMIRFGALGDKVIIGEGIETTLAYREICHLFGFLPDEWSFAAAGSKDNLCGGCMDTIPHPTLTVDEGPRAGKPVMVPNGVPNPEMPGVILPEHVREAIILGDGDCDSVMMQMKVKAQLLRWRSAGRSARPHFAPAGMDWNDVTKALAPKAAREDVYA